MRIRVGYQSILELINRVTPAASTTATPLLLKRTPPGAVCGREADARPNEAASPLNVRRRSNLPPSRRSVTPQPDENAFQCVQIAEVHQYLAAAASAELDLNRCGKQIG